MSTLLLSGCINNNNNKDIQDEDDITDNIPEEEIMKLEIDENVLDVSWNNNASVTALNEIKPITKKKLIKRIEEYKPKYIYQRYNGEIKQFEVVNNNYLVDTKTGMSFDLRSHLMLGKISEKLIDLIEIGDLVKIEDNWGEIHWFEVYENSGIYQYEILEIATKEMMESISYKVKE